MKWPCAYRRWYIKRIEEEIEQARKAQSDIPTKTPVHNTPDIRQMTGKAKAITPNARMQRFT